MLRFFVNATASKGCFCLVWFTNVDSVWFLLNFKSPSIQNFKFLLSSDPPTLIISDSSWITNFLYPEFHGVLIKQHRSFFIPPILKSPASRMLNLYWLWSINVVYLRFLLTFKCQHLQFQIYPGFWSSNLKNSWFLYGISNYQHQNFKFLASFIHQHPILRFFLNL